MTELQIGDLMTHVSLGLNGLEFKLFLLSVLKEKERSEQEKCL